MGNIIDKLKEKKLNWVFNLYYNEQKWMTDMKYNLAEVLKTQPN